MLKVNSNMGAVGLIPPAPDKSPHQNQIALPALRRIRSFRQRA
jgi:hypothetical protein